MEFVLRGFPSTSTRKECSRVIIKEFVLTGFPYVLRGFLYVLRGFPCTSIRNVCMQHGYWNHFIFSTDFVLKEFVLRGFSCTRNVYMQHEYQNHFIFSTVFILKEFVLRGFPLHTKARWL